MAGPPLATLHEVLNRGCGTDPGRHRNGCPQQQRRR
jgi:hypothetical protein